MRYRDVIYVNVSRLCFSSLRRNLVENGILGILRYTMQLETVTWMYANFS
ncbi:unnamed protein product [Acanthoscelides obtectus]|uniref:Uncharacterized protein n=1 Tax=Acanthoscelides obtectus TaxID=200917 RepID=A0A9P0MIR5_ACAOB|nr:unnamed protein product [Acanthoscelides obtectus]CAH2014958.1 unnamed protein product [Acanthoscelides obtectus]CAK1634582.1 hypothetical protein AOBTE_LOCUS8816 [Acanthoscelides obtectus]CAK1634599.1 hypothetical protein AOBTE_LOCUS8824 [Acanthoscelides obtectus]